MPAYKSPRWTAAFFQRFVLVLFGLSILVVLELSLRLLGIGVVDLHEDPFLGFSEHHPVFETYGTQDGSLRARTVREKLKWFNEQEFSLSKAPGTFRIFTLGGSTTYGRPYGTQTSFSCWLGELLKHASGLAQHFEVINAGGISYASYRVVVVLKEILTYDPDLVIIYTGHNEFLESRTYQHLLGQPSVWLRSRESFSTLRIYSLLESVIEKARTEFGTGDQMRTPSGGGLLSPEVETLLDRSAGLDYYQRDSVYARGVFEHFRFNVNRMIRLCSKAGVPVLFCRPVDNLKDFSPFKSMPSVELASADRMRLKRLLSTGRMSLAELRVAEGLKTLKQVVRLDPLFAEAWFYLGRALLAIGDTVQARQALLQARELDVCPLRAQEPIHLILEEETKMADVGLLDLPVLLAAHSPGGVIGSETLIDHIHPSPQYHLLIAREIAGWMKEHGFLKQSSLPGEDRIQAIYGRVIASLSDEYMSRGVLNLAKVLVWAKKFEEVRSLFDSRWEDVSHIGEAHYLMGVVFENLGEPQKALACYGKALEKMPKHRQSLRRLAETSEKSGDPFRAEEAYRQALAIFPEDVPLLSNYGILLARQGRSEQAMEMFDHAARIEPDSPELNNNIGLLHSINRQYGQAIAAFNRALQANPGDPQAYHNLGVAYTLLKRFSEAEQAFLEALKRNPEHDSARNNLGNIYRQTGRMAQAEEQFRLALTINPGRVEVYINLALLYRDSGKISLAREVASHGLECFPEEPRLARIAESLRN